MGGAYQSFTITKFVPGDKKYPLRINCAFYTMIPSERQVWKVVVMPDGTKRHSNAEYLKEWQLLDDTPIPLPQITHVIIDPTAAIAASVETPKRTKGSKKPTKIAASASGSTESSTSVLPVVPAVVSASASDILESSTSVLPVAPAVVSASVPDSIDSSTSVLPAVPAVVSASAPDSTESSTSVLLVASAVVADSAPDSIDSSTVVLPAVPTVVADSAPDSTESSTVVLPAAPAAVTDSELGLSDAISYPCFGSIYVSVRFGPIPRELNASDNLVVTARRCLAEYLGDEVEPEYDCTMEGIEPKCRNDIAGVVYKVGCVDENLPLSVCHVFNVHDDVYCMWESSGGPTEEDTFHYFTEKFTRQVFSDVTSLDRFTQPAWLWLLNQTEPSEMQEEGTDSAGTKLQEITHYHITDTVERVPERVPLTNAQSAAVDIIAEHPSPHTLGASEQMIVQDDEVEVISKAENIARLHQEFKSILSNGNKAVFDIPQYLDIPAVVLEQEGITAEKLSQLFKKPFDVSRINWSVAGKTISLASFHYPDSNHVCSGNQGSYNKFSYINEKEPCSLYRWELKGCVTTKLFMNDGNGVVRTFFAMSQLQCATNTKFANNQLILLAIMTTLCVDQRNDFLIYNKSTKAVQLHQGFSFIRNFYCNIDVKIDLKLMEMERLKFFKRYSLIYDPLRGVPRDTKDPSKINDPSIKNAQFEELSAQWKICNGARGVPQSDDFVSPTVKKLQFPPPPLRNSTLKASASGQPKANPTQSKSAASATKSRAKHHVQQPQRGARSATKTPRSSVAVKAVKVNTSSIPVATLGSVRADVDLKGLQNLLKGLETTISNLSVPQVRLPAKVAVSAGATTQHSNDLVKCSKYVFFLFVYNACVLHL
jgi:hypothetical protein